MRKRGGFKKGRPDLSDADYIAKYKARTIVNEHGCWIWQGFIHPLGYGDTCYRGIGWRVHRIMHKQHNPNFDPKLDVCHSCDTPSCINPDHLWQGTEKDNMEDCTRKGRIAEQRVTHCPRGHAYDEANTYVLVKPNGHKARNCKACSRERCRRRWKEHGQVLRERQRQRRLQAKQRSAEQQSGVQSENP